MDTKLYIWCALSALLGMALHVFAVKLPAALTRAKTANVKLTGMQFLMSELPGLCSTLAAIAIALLVVDEVLNYKPNLSGWLKGLFAFYGYTGSSILLAVFGKVGKQLNSIVDIKTNIADEVTVNPQTSIKK